MDVFGQNLVIWYRRLRPETTLFYGVDDNVISNLYIPITNVIMGGVASDSSHINTSTYQVVYISSLKFLLLCFFVV